MMINLSYSKLADNKYLAVTNGDSNIPIGVAVDGEIKSVLETLQKIYTDHPKLIEKVIINHYKSIVSYVHSHATEMRVEDWASAPIIGISESKEIEPNLYEVKYFVSGESARLMHGFVSGEFLEAMSYIIKDYENNPKLYYAFLIQNKNDFLKKLLRRG